MIKKVSVFQMLDLISTGSFLHIKPVFSPSVVLVDVR